jgi:hypothetical protein
VAQHPTADSRVFQQRRVPIAPDVRQQPPLQRPRVRRVQGQETAHPLRRGRGYPEAKHAALVMADQPYRARPRASMSASTSRTWLALS